MSESEYINNQIDFSTFNSFGISEDMIAKSIDRACDFFGLERPCDIITGDTLGVYTNNPYIERDDIFVYNMAQLEDIGIIGQESLDLVMMHEGAHRMLQDGKIAFSSHQEELCCDYMAGICAGLNGINTIHLTDFLSTCKECDTHPAGNDRVAAVEYGVGFARNYMEEYDTPPTFRECLDNFIDVLHSGFNEHNHIVEYAEETEQHIKLHEIQHEMDYREYEMKYYNHILEMNPNNQIAIEHLKIAHQEYVNAKSLYSELNEVCEDMRDVSQFEHQDITFKGKYTEPEIKSKIKDAEDRIRHKTAEIRRHSDLLKSTKYPETEKMHIKNAERELNKAKADLNKWKNETPKDKS